VSDPSGRWNFSTRVCRQIILRLVHVGFLPVFSPPYPDLGPARSLRSPCRSSGLQGRTQRCVRRGEARALCSRPARMGLLSRAEARPTERTFSMPTLDPARCPPSMRWAITPGAAGDGRCGGQLHGPPRQTVTTCGDRCRHIVTAGGGRGRRTPPAGSQNLLSGTGLVVGTEVVKRVWGGKVGGDAQGSQGG
jgi:hypothetical protein